MAESEYKSLDVASYIVNFCRDNAIEYNNTKIQKLMYCCYGSILALFSKRLCDEYPRAWQYGPVFPRVYNYFNKGKDILSICPNLDADPEWISLIHDVIKTFGGFSASALSAWTHVKGSPWDRVVNDMAAPNSIIPDDLIAKYFKEYVINV
jgi:uncharacterized phage-associated protein